MKKKILGFFAIIIILALLCALGTLGYVIYDQITNFGVPDRDRDRDTEQTTSVVETADLTSEPDETEETEKVSGSIVDIFGGAETAIETTAPVVTERIDEETFDDGTKAVYSYDENGNMSEKVLYGADGEKLSRTLYIYVDDKVVCDKLYNAADKLEVENIYGDEGITTTVFEYDEENKMVGGMRYVFAGENYEEHTLNAYGGVTYSQYYDANGAVVLTREHHFTPAGYRDGYTETDKDGNNIRYNDDGTVREEVTTAATTVATTKAKPKPKPATTTTAKTTVTTTAPKPAEPEIYTETSVSGSDKVVKYYNIAKDGTKTLSNTITYRTINGKEVILTNIDEIRGYGRQNEYDANGNLLRYLTYNVKYGKRTLEILYDAAGNVQKRVTYEYNNEGKKVRESTYDASDNLTGYITYEYIKANNGTKTKVITYDANGKAISTIVR